MIRLLALLLLLPALAQAEAVCATRQMAATANPMATDAALAILRGGGSAVDAAIAAQAALSVVEPHASGLLGGGVLLVWDPQARRLHHYEGIAAAPAAATGSLVIDTDGQRLPPATVARSGRAVAVPGSLAALALAAERHGRLPWAVLLEPAVVLAGDGFPMPAYLHNVLRARAVFLRARPELRAIFFGADGEPLPVGALVRNPDQAGALRLLQRDGIAALREGPLAEAVLAAQREGPIPGLMSAEDLRDFRAVEREPLCGAAFGRRVCTAAAPSSGGVSVLQQLGLLERAGFAQAAPGSALAAHLLIEAGRLARADRVRWIGDPAPGDNPVEDRAAALVSPGYLDARARRIRADAAMAEAPAGVAGEEGLTTHIAVVDRWGGAVAFTTTNNLNFGAERLAMGIALNNGLTNFAVSGDGPNRMAPRKRPATTMAPTMVLGADGAPEIVIGAGGGAWIPDAVAGALAEMLAWNADAWRAVARPRLGAQGGAVELEAGTAAAALLPELTALGHAPRVVPINTGLQVIRRTPAGLEGAADPRRDGTAAGD